MSVRTAVGSYKCVVEHVALAQELDDRPDHVVHREQRRPAVTEVAILPALCACRERRVLPHVLGLALPAHIVVGRARRGKPLERPLMPRRRLCRVVRCVDADVREEGARVGEGLRVEPAKCTVANLGSLVRGAKLGAVAARDRDGDRVSVRVRVRCEERR